MVRARRGYFSILVLIIGFLSALSWDLAQFAVQDDAGVIKKIPTKHKVVALTIDDGPHQVTTPMLLKVLEEKKVKATFFILGTNAENNLHLVAREAAAGHEVANHGYSHKKLSGLSVAEMEEEINKTEALLLRVSEKPLFFRPPYGSYNDQTVTALKDKGYTTVLWTVDSNDWRLPNPEQIAQNVIQAVAPGKIILMHDGQYPIPTIDALPIIIDSLRKDGYDFVTMSELLNYYEKR
ncbi:MAG: polysaccharide deacetylase family protein [Sporomusaceae bacterium]|jgi:peptidoglycan/xylan/chitin deacetylase (PgdA/CDA1 family)|nr:polysaccharide deacetylase family protein [Sporomusaceae bacterium]